MLAGSLLVIALALTVTAAAAGIGALYRTLTRNERNPA
jgi:hypothetical protein